MGNLCVRTRAICWRHKQCPREARLRSSFCLLFSSARVLSPVRPIFSSRVLDPGEVCRALRVVHQHALDTQRNPEDVLSGAHFASFPRGLCQGRRIAAGGREGSAHRPAGEEDGLAVIRDLPSFGAAGWAEMSLCWLGALVCWFRRWA